MDLNERLINGDKSGRSKSITDNKTILNHHIQENFSSYSTLIGLIKRLVESALPKQTGLA